MAGDIFSTIWHTFGGVNSFQFLHHGHNIMVKVEIVNKPGSLRVTVFPCHQFKVIIRELLRSDKAAIKLNRKVKTCRQNLLFRNKTVKSYLCI